MAERETERTHPKQAESSPEIVAANGREKNKPGLQLEQRKSGGGERERETERERTESVVCSAQKEMGKENRFGENVSLRPGSKIQDMAWF